MRPPTNPVVYFEIPVVNLQRAKEFYTAVFSWSFENEVIDGNEMALFPFVDSRSGISGALAQGEVYRPTKDGVIVYFATSNIDVTMARVLANGGAELYSKTPVGLLGFVAEFEDSEGNRIALHQAPD